MSVDAAATRVRLLAAVADGRVAAECERLGIELLVLVGSAVGSADPGDIDLAIGYEPGVVPDPLAFLDAMAVLVPGDDLDILDLDRAGPVSRH